MNAKTRQKPTGLTFTTGTDDLAGLTVETVPQLTPKTGTRRYKPRARKCANKACTKVFTPNAKHGRYCSDKCRKTGYRKRIAKAQALQPADPVLEVVSCAYCGGTFFAEAGKDAKFCKPSHRTAAWRQRREAAVNALLSDLANMNEQEVADLIETSGMKKIGRYLRQQGFVYDEHQRAWLIPIQSDNVFVPGY